MLSKTEDNTALRKYLLGKLPAEERDAVELWLMSDQDALDLVNAAEDDLIDDSLNSRLSVDDLERFENHFIASPERRRKVQFSRVFRRYIADAYLPDKPVPVNRPSFGRALTDLFTRRPAAVYAFSALTLLLIGATAWLAVQVSGLERAARLATAEIDQLKQKSADDDDQLLTFQKAFRSLPSSPPDAPVLVAQNLTPNRLVRGGSNTVPGNKIVSIPISEATQFVRFELTPAKDEYPSYRVSLADEDDRTLWTLDGFTSTSGVVTVTILAERFKRGSGAYTFKLSGTGALASEDGSSFHFQVVRQ
jgi:hypothetical protein